MRGVFTCRLFGQMISCPQRFPPVLCQVRSDWTCPWCWNAFYPKTPVSCFCCKSKNSRLFCILPCTVGHSVSAKPGSSFWRSFWNPNRRSRCKKNPLSLSSQSLQRLHRFREDFIFLDLTEKNKEIGFTDNYCSARSVEIFPVWRTGGTRNSGWIIICNQKHCSWCGVGVSFLLCWINLDFYYPPPSPLKNKTWPVYQMVV